MTIEKARCKASFEFNVQKQLVPDPSGRHMAKSLTWKLELRVIEVAGSLLLVILAVLLILEKKGDNGGGIPEVL